MNVPQRKRHLQTFLKKKVNKSRISKLEKDKKIIISAMKKKLQFSRRTGKPVNRPGEQLIDLPLAIADNDGNPLKGNKSYTTQFLE